MRHITSLAATLVLGASLSGPFTVRANADDHPKRYYDRDRKDYHEWNEKEDRAYRKYLEEKHRSYRSWNKARAAEQREYWRWRHEHPEY
jgi:hypothetical protein